MLSNFTYLYGQPTCCALSLAFGILIIFNLISINKCVANGHSLFFMLSSTTYGCFLGNFREINFSNKLLTSCAIFDSHIALLCYNFVMVVS